MKQTFQINKIFLILGFVMALICVVNAEDDDDECLVCEFIVGAAIAACQSYETCNNILGIITIVIIIVGSISYCLSDSKDQYYEKPSCKSISKRCIAAGAGYGFGKTIF